VSWSPRGKQIAIGLQDGEIVAFSPTDTQARKIAFPPPESVPNQGVLSMTWLSNSAFHVIYAPPGPLIPDGVQTHFIIHFDSKAGTVKYTSVNPPHYPFPGLREPSSSTLVLRNWEPSKFLLIIGDSASSEFGVLRAIEEGSDEKWYNVDLEESNTPSMPLDRETEDTVLVGLELDLTWTETYRFFDPTGEESELPPTPIMYAYASDGTLPAWHVINSKGARYPGMITPGETSATDNQPSNNETSATPAPTFGQPSQMSSTSPFGVRADAPSTPSAFGQTSTLGQSLGFGSPTPSTSAFGQPSLGFSAFGSSTTPSSGGFGAFAQLKPAEFGTGFGFGGSQTTPASDPSPSPAAMTREESMGAEDSTPMFGGMSLGGGGGGGEASAGDSTSAPKTNSMFGSFGQGASNTTSSSDTVLAFGGVIKPATGFGGGGAFGSSTSSSFGGGGAFGSSTSSAFGGGGTSSNTGFASKPAAPAFGQSGFGSKPASPSFGQSSFGSQASPAFGQSSFGSLKPTTTMSGGFGAFAQQSTSMTGAASSSTSGGGFSAFAQGGTSSFASASSGGGGSGSLFGQSSSSPFGSAATPSGSAFGSSAPATPASASAPQDDSTSQASDVGEGHFDILSPESSVLMILS
jgi:nucleoporin NUP159